MHYWCRTISQIKHAFKLTPFKMKSDVSLLFSTNPPAFSALPGIFCLLTCLHSEENQVAVACCPETDLGPAKGDATGRCRSAPGR